MTRDDLAGQRFQHLDNARLQPGSGQHCGQGCKVEIKFDPFTQPVFADDHAKGGLRELSQEGDFVFEKEAQVIDAVAQHGQPLNAQTECVACEFFIIDADLPKHFCMYHSATQHLDPAAMTTNAAAFALTEDAAHVYFSGRFRKREKRGSKPDRQVPFKKFFKEKDEHAL